VLEHGGFYLHNKDVLTTVTAHYSTLLGFSFLEWLGRLHVTIREFSNTLGGKTVFLGFYGWICPTDLVWLGILEN